MKVVIMTILAMITLTMVSCSSQVQKDIEKEKKSIQLSDQQKSILDRAHKAILESPDLDQKTKDDFIALQYQTYAKVQEINDELKKVKIIFFKTLAHNKKEDRKTNELIRQMKELHNKKLDIMISAFYQARDILGQDSDYNNPHMLWIDEMDFGPKL